MRVGVLSDTHGRVDLALKAINEMGKIDVLVHAGDFYEDAIDLEKRLQIPVKAVKGNCDYFIKTKEDLIFEIAGKKIFLTHGHKYNVKRNYLNLKYKGEEEGVDLIIFGHTHIPEMIKEENLILFNPGSVSLPRIAKVGTYGIIELTTNKILPYIKMLKS